MNPNQPSRCDSPLWAEIRPMSAREFSARSFCERWGRAAEDELARRRAARRETFTPDEKGAA